MTDRIAIVGGGIAGLAAAHRLATDGVDVTIFERSDQVGGRIRSSPFAGVPGVDEGADAFLARVPEGVALAADVGLGEALVHPEPVGAAVWHQALHPIPDGLLLGVPGKVGPIAKTGLLSWRGKLRAALEPLLPRTALDSDSIGEFIRARFGNEVHERLVDALVGSIYATDTDRFSLAEVPQLNALAEANRSLLLGARTSKQAAGTAAATTSPIFAAPRRGVAELTRATADAVVAAGGTLQLSHTVRSITAAGPGWDIDDQRFGAVILATPALVASSLLTAVAPEASAALGTAETADVIMVTLHVEEGEWPDRFSGLSGYLVPKPAQRSVTAASFGSQKWGHWQPPEGGQILRVSLGRDGQPALQFSDGEVLERVLDDLCIQLGVRFTPRDTRISRWPGAFAQYRPHHARWVDAVEAALPSGVFVTGAAYRGIGIPACIRDGAAIGQRAAKSLRSLQD